jgi:hypothetical protein
MRAHIAHGMGSKAGSQSLCAPSWGRHEPCPTFMISEMNEILQIYIVHLPLATRFINSGETNLTTRAPALNTPALGWVEGNGPTAACVVSRSSLGSHVVDAAGQVADRVVRLCAGDCEGVAAVPVRGAEGWMP